MSHLAPGQAPSSRSLADFLAEQIRSGKTLLISGGTGAGKATLLRILADSIPGHERIFVIADSSELHIQKLNILAVEYQADSFKTSLSFDDFLKSDRRWRPDRVILSEVRGIKARTPPPFLQHGPCRVAGDDSCQLGRESPPPFRQSGHTQPRPDHLLRHRGRDWRSRRSSRAYRASTGPPSSVKYWRFVDTTATRNASKFEPSGWNRRQCKNTSATPYRSRLP
jgi:hypothetical protein